MSKFGLLFSEKKSTLKERFIFFLEYFFFQKVVGVQKSNQEVKNVASLYKNQGRSSHLKRD